MGLYFGRQSKIARVNGFLFWEWTCGGGDYIQNFSSLLLFFSLFGDTKKYPLYSS